MMEIYTLETCPYCQKVIEYLQENKIEYKKNDITVPKHEAMLMKLGGKHQVPFLYDAVNKVKMYESSDIIEYLKERKNNNAL